MRKFRMLALIWLVIAPLAMAPQSDAEKIKAGPVQSTGGRECVFPLCGGMMIQSVNERDVVVHEIVYGPDGPTWQILEDGTAQYLHRDPRGNTVMLTDGAAAGVLERVTYDPYGAPRFQDPANQDKRDVLGIFLAESDYDNPQLFSSLWYEPEMGLRTGAAGTDRVGYYRLGTRLYNPDEGRLATRPTVLEAQTVHLSLQIDGNEVQGEGHAPDIEFIQIWNQGGIVVTAAIAIPNLIEARKGANESDGDDLPDFLDVDSDNRRYLYFSKVADDTSSCWIRTNQLHTHSAAKVVVRGWDSEIKEMVGSSSGTPGGGAGKVMVLDLH
jgi:hypothetical protein